MNDSIDSTPRMNPLQRGIDMEKIKHTAEMSTRKLKENAEMSKKKLKELRDVQKMSMYLRAPPVPKNQPALSERKQSEFIAIIVGGTLLTINAGFINAVTLLYSGLTTSHVTGTFTKTAVFAETGQTKMFFEFFFVIPFFMFGSFLTSLLVSYQTFYMGRAYNKVFLLGTFFLLISCLFGMYLPEHQIYTYFVAIACGMQNAMTTNYSGSVLRTTHMTGMATDVGIVLGKVAKGQYKDAWKLKLFIPMMIGFFCGGLLGAKAVRDHGPSALLLNVAIFGGTGLLYALYVSTYHRISFMQALLSSQDLKPATEPTAVPTGSVALPQQDIEAGFDHDDELDEDDADISLHDDLNHYIESDHGSEGDEELKIEHGDNQLLITGIQSL